MDKSKRKNEAGKVYKPQGTHFWGLAFILLIIVIHIASIFFFVEDTNSRLWISHLIVMAMYSAIFYFLFTKAANSSFRVYEDGLEWQLGKSRVFTLWKNMRSIERKNEGDGASYGIQLVKPVDVEGSSSKVDKFFFGTSTDYIRLTGTVPVSTSWLGFQKGNTIKLDEFAKTEFGQDLLYYAPHLFRQGQS